MRDTYARIEQNPLFRSIPSAQTPPLSASSGPPCPLFRVFTLYGQNGGPDQWLAAIGVPAWGRRQHENRPQACHSGSVSARLYGRMPQLVEWAVVDAIGGKFLRAVLQDVYRRYPFLLSMANKPMSLTSRFRGPPTRGSRGIALAQNVGNTKAWVISFFMKAEDILRLAFGWQERINVQTPHPRR